MSSDGKASPTFSVRSRAWTKSTTASDGEDSPRSRTSTLSWDEEDSSTLRVRSRTPTVKDLAFGAAGIGCLYSDVTPEQARDTIQTALKHGIDYVDTAPWYGAGLSESRCAEALEGIAGIKLSTKCGRLVKPLADVNRDTDMVEEYYFGHFITDAYHANCVVWDYSADGIRESVRQSCERLQCEKLDCLRLHDCADEERWNAAIEGGAVEAMVDLRSKGVVSEIGLGMMSAEYALKFLRRYPVGTFDSLMLACSWNLLDQDGFEVLCECQKLGVRVQNVGIFASGVLWGSPYYRYEAVPQAVADRVQAWKSLAEEHGLSLPQVALAFALLPEVVEKAAVGCTTPEQVEQNVALCGSYVPDALWAEAREQGLLGVHVPLPSDW